MSLKILIVHNKYQQQGGEDAVVENESALLKDAGHKVQLYIVSNNAIYGVTRKIKTFLDSSYSETAKRDIGNEIGVFQPDIVHVHNFFPLLTPSIYDACLEAGVPVVQTLHNYRTVCPGALLIRNGNVCEKCITRSPFWGAWHRCYRDSLSGSLAAARMVFLHRKLETWQKKVSLFIALSEFSRRKFIAGNFPKDRIVVKPNFVKDPGYRNTVSRNGALFVGRLSPEKGVTILIEAWRHTGYPLRIVGDGPLMDEAIALAPSNVRFVGHISAKMVGDEMSRAAFLVLPGICYENFPMAIGEAYAAGLPVIVSKLGAMAEIVDDGVTGLHTNPADSADLAAKVHWAIAHPREMLEMGRNARAEYEEKYTSEKNYQKLMTVYHQAISG